MGLLSKIFKRPKAVTGSGYRTFTEFDPVFTPYNGGVYGKALTRAVIERFAVACSKLKPEVVGKAHPQIARAFRTSPNDFMTWPKFLARVATILEAENTAFVVPSYAPDMQTKVGLWPLYCQTADLIEYKGEPWFRFWTASGDNLALPASEVCVLTRHQYTSDVFGEAECLDSTLKLLDAQEQAQSYAMENGAKIRFIGELAGQVREEDMEKKRKRFVDANLSRENASGLMLYDATFTNVRQVDNQSYVMDDGEMQRIQENVFNYYGMNEKVLQNDYDENAWDAYYEGKVEPFAVQLGEGLTQMLYTTRERTAGNQVTFSSNRLEYSSNASKRNMIKDMVDRAIITPNEGREILQLPPVEGGDEFVIRGEYVSARSVTISEGTLHDDGEYDSDEERKPYDGEDPDAEEVDDAS